MAVTLFISVWLMIRAMHAPSSIVITQILEQALFLRDVDSLFRCIEYHSIEYYIAELVGWITWNPLLSLFGSLR